MLRAGIDIGGTFTDTVVLNQVTGKITISKTLTTPGDYSSGVLTGLGEALQAVSSHGTDLDIVIHGTTLVANALIQRKGAKTSLITTKGFRDTLEIRREKRFDLYDIFIDMPEPLVPRYLRKEVDERVLNDGSVLIPLDEQGAREAVAALVVEDVESIAVCFLHSFRNPAHEKRMKEIILELIPEMFVSLSIEVVPEIREYERTSTAVVNAFCQPLMTRYLSRLERKLKEQGYQRPLYVMLSNGGITISDTARRFPVRVVESGPVGGAIAASYYADLLGLKRVVSFDMGGTTAKICLIEDGRPLTTRDFEVARMYRFKKKSGYPIKVPVIDMMEIGAGGGSIAYVDEMGLLKVGPQSAEARPGPACYSLGGEEPTVTDADLCLGFLNANYFLGGRMVLNEDKAIRALKKVSQPLNMDEETAAVGIVDVVNENMANAARVHTAEKGKDLRSFALVAFGGAGPIHACGVAEKLGIKKVVVPLGGGATSALGFLVAPVAFDAVRTLMSGVKQMDFDQLNKLLGEMEEEVTGRLLEVGVDRNAIKLSRSCDMRYVGQSHEIEVPIPNKRLSSTEVPALYKAFNKEYLRLYHIINEGYKIEALSWKVVGSGPKAKTVLNKLPISRTTSPGAALKGKRAVLLPGKSDRKRASVYDRYRLQPGMEFPGPSIVEERESTVVVYAGWRGVVDEYLNLILTTG